MVSMSGKSARSSALRSVGRRAFPPPEMVATSGCSETVTSQKKVLGRVSLRQRLWKEQGFTVQ